MTARARICAGLAALLAAAPALASEETEGTVPMSPAWLEAYEMQGDVFTPEQRSLLSHLAWHAAVANICDGLSLSTMPASARRSGGSNIPTLPPCPTTNCAITSTMSR